MDYRDIRDYQRTGSHRGRHFTILVWQPEGGRAFVKEVRSDELPPIVDPDLGSFETPMQALEAGEQFAREMIER